jgi:transcriptional regulator with XRE-family HTH domain
MADAARDVNFEEYDPVSVGKRLQEGRQAMGLTRRGVAEETGIPENTVYKIETGRAEPSLSRLRKLCRLYDIPYSAIMAEVDGGDDDQGGKDDSAEDPVTEARSHLRHAATLLGLKVVDESNGEAVGPAVKVEADEDVSATAVLSQLAEFTDGAPHKADPDQLKRRIEAARRELDREKPEALLDAADERGVKLSDEEQSRVTGGHAFNDEGEARDHLRRLLMVHAVYGVDPRRLTLEAVKKLNKQLAQVLPDAAEKSPSDGGVVAHGRDFLEAPMEMLTASDSDVRDRMVWELLPHLIDAAEAGEAPRLSDTKAFPRAGGRKG